MGQSAFQPIAATQNIAAISYPPAVVQLAFLDGEILSVSSYADEVFSEDACFALKNLEKVSAEILHEIQERMWQAACERLEASLSQFATLQDLCDSEALMNRKFFGQRAPTGPANVMNAVRMKEVQIVRASNADSESRLMVGVFGECAWDTEFGVAILFDADGTLIAAGGA